jgi:Transposase DDE domain
LDDDGFSAAVLEKLPLADSVWRLLHCTLDDPWLEELWARHRGRCYEQDVKFSTLAHLIADALLEHGGSGHQAFERAQEREILPVSITSASEKLGNLPLPVSEALLAEGTRRMQAVLPATPAVDPLPDCWADHELFGADGKAVQHGKRLLKPLRRLRAGILGARASVGLNLRTGLAVALVGHLDGEAGEGARTEDLVPKLAAAAGPGRPWVVVLDRLDCNLSFPQKVLKAGGHFLIRYCGNTTFVPDAARPAQESRDARGRRIVQEWGWLGKAQTAKRLYVRRITLDLPHGKSISVVTDLWNETKDPAEEILMTYQKRWGIETVFHQITAVFSLRHRIGMQPKAVLFQLSFCLLLYNVLQVVRGHLAWHQGCAAEKIANEKLFSDVERQLVAVSELVAVEPLLSLLGVVPTAAELRERLREGLRGVWSDRWWKAPSSGRGGHQKVKTRVRGNHTSTYRVLQQAHTQKIRPPVAAQRP